jgi:hypothetical protein
MRLLNTSTLKLHEFVGDSIPHYTILSHRWEKEEVLFQDLESGRGIDIEGFSKIKRCCEKAARDGWEYAWVDSCCIDKRSSAELSEAINSMFEWYNRSEVCYVYLSDVPTGMYFEKHYAASSEFRCSKWWTRGWTLQELIAPQNVIFYNREWVEIGSKGYLGILISLITGISRPHLRDYENASVAQKMSWASRRMTSRPEDLAYSLMGIFQVHMPPLYGEGATRAFERLQLEILSKSDDESLFAWQQRGPRISYTQGLLASSPSDFRDSGEIYRTESTVRQRPPFMMTNKGLRIELILIRATKETYVTPLQCKWKSGSTVGIELSRELGVREDDGSYYQNIFTRGGSLITFTQTDQEAYSLLPSMTVIFVRQRRQRQRKDLFMSSSGPVPILLKTNSLRDHGFTNFYRRAGDIRSHDDIPWEMEVLAERQQDSAFVMEGYEEVLWLSFTQESHSDLIKPSAMAVEDSLGDKFVIFLRRCYTGSLTAMTVRIIFPRESMVPHTVSGSNHAVNRVSRRLPSGKSVSAALKVGAQSGERVLILDIAVDPEGYLSWLDVGSIIEV